MRKSSLLFFWLIIAIVISSFCALTYLVGQQNLRQQANDPQIQIAQDLVNELNSAQNLTASNLQVNPANSLAPFYIIYDGQGQISASTAMIEGSKLPTGVFDYVKNHGEDRITWQPSSDVRIAAVVMPYRDGYVLAGRSLKEVEKREDQLLFDVFDGWVATMLVTTALILLMSKKAK